MTYYNLENQARQFAREKHQGQKRKYTGLPYIVHPSEVVEILRTVEHTEAMLAAAWLHDVVEDCHVFFGDIERQFGPEVAQLVAEVTDVSKPGDGNRARRKAIDREHIASASAAGKTIKLADLISNSVSICAHDPDFAKVYMKEKAELLKVMGGGDTTLLAWAAEIVHQWELKQQ